MTSNHSREHPKSPLSQALETLSGMNARLLQLSTELPPSHPTGKGLVKDLLSDLQAVRQHVQTASRTSTGTTEETDSLRRRCDRLRLLLEIADLLHGTLDTDDLATRILDAVLEWVGAERGVLLVQDPATGEHLMRVGRKLTASAYTSSEVALPRTVVAQVIREKKPVYATDVQGDPKLMAMASIRDLNIRSLACLPVILNDEVLGVVYIDYQAAQYRMGPEERATLESVCRQAALALSNANRYQRAREWARRAGAIGGAGRMIGTSPAMRDVFELINQVALSPSTSVLIAGASGTGKELAARAIHDLSSRASEPFVAVNCAALPPNLLESELFGYEKGAFTDAKTRHIGLIEQSDKGTLFLDEIGEMSPSLQSKVLRVLEDRTFRRLGGAKDINVDIRVIAATNIDIQRAVASGDFREDLFYRLNVFPIDLPLLKDRGDDIILIANAVIDELNSRLGTRIQPIDPAGRVAHALRSYDWPGNVRELRNVLERAMILSRTASLAIDTFPAPIGAPREPAGAHGVRPLYQPLVPPSERGLDSTLASLEEIENAHIDRVLDAADGDKRRAAEILGINVATLYRKLKRRRLGE